MFQARRWCFTINNPVLCVNYYDALLKIDAIRRFVYGTEMGESGTRHLQGYLELNKRTRLAPLKIVFPTAHWESAKGNWSQNYKYCTKENAHVQHGDWSGAQKDITAKLNKKDIIKRIINGDRTALCLNGYLNHKRSIDSVVGTLRYEQEKRRRYGELKDALLRPWQRLVMKHLMQQTDRKITWITDEVGGKGKTWFAAYLRDVYQFDLLNGTTATKDVVGMLGDHIRGIAFDVTRNDASHFSYQTLEHAKNGYMVTGKYEGIKRLFKIVPVIVFANFDPIRTSLSEDRWDIINLHDGLFKEKNQTPTYDPKETYPPPEPPQDPLKEEDV